MSLSGVLGNALTGLNASQVGLRSASNNVANVNTPGYARTTPNLISRNVGGVAMGVQIEGVTRIADKFLQAASIKAISDEGRASALATALDRVQAQFGGLDDPGSIFSRMNKVFDSLSQASVDPSLSVARLSAAADIESFFDETTRLSIEIKQQRQEAEARINSNVQRVNEILGELFELNASVQNLASGGGDNSGAANRQSELLDELSSIMDIRATTQPDGRVVVRTEDGVLLMDNFAMNITYQPAGTGAFKTTYGSISAVPPNGVAVELDRHIVSGELRGLMELRDVHLPNMAEELAEMATGFADTLNAAHNNASSYPAPQILTGGNTGWDVNDYHYFTGQMTIGVSDATGALVSRVDVDFDSATLSVDGGAAVGIGNTIGTLTTAIDAALGANGSMSFSNGVMSLQADVAGNGVSILQDEANPADRGGRGFSHFFGLNDLVRSDRPYFFETGINGSRPHLFSAGESVTFDVTTTSGATVASVNIPVVAGQSFNDLITAINDATTGVGRYVNFALDAQGRLIQTPVAGFEAFNVDLGGDTTARTSSGVSFSELFGVGLDAKAGRAEIFSVDPAIRANSDLLALGQLDIDAATVAGDIVLSAGDNRGGILLQQSLGETRTFNAAGSLAQSNANLNDYAARFAGMVGSRAARAESEAESANVLMQTAAQKRADVEGVNLDEELASMTMYQQSYNASARMLQAAKEMADTLMNVL
ncbi:flagellar hook-associated protein FlgK [Maricaulis sp.]|uniref:flagellar hook-associated protein FlgK n=1 Tax=Maricaulis sp. TaxID=1486257 RepID=UPI00260AAE4C|nr:flagellar hook-associated protein FlgK [Maricaulis sp.]